MLTLTLFRHAKSSRDDPSLADHDRPLAARGRDDAPRMGAWMAVNAPRPDLVICSTALRTRETAALAFADWPSPPALHLEARLYHAAPETLLAVVHGTPRGVRQLMLVGHNPGLHEFALGLATGGDPTLLEALAAKLPTSGLAVIGVDRASFADVRFGEGRLLAFMTPRRLPADGGA